MEGNAGKVSVYKNISKYGSYSWLDGLCVRPIPSANNNVWSLVM
jgi:hypothetical protein